MLKKGLFCRMIALGLALGAFGASAESANAIVRLLNSRASGSRKGYERAAEEVAKSAREGKTVHGYVLALVSRDPNAPAAARMDEATRTNYLNACRASLRRSMLEKNNPMAMYLLSLETSDTNLLQRAAAGGNVQAMNAWGTYVLTCALNESRTTNELARAMECAFTCFSQAAGKGDANGLYNLGTCHARGFGVPRDDRNAFDCFRSAAEKGHPEAINNIGWFFREGRVVEKDPVMSARWFAKSAEYGNAYGQFNYALALQRGDGVKKDEAAAAVLLKKSSENGCIEALDAYGVALWKGRGVKADHAEAFRLFMQASKLGYPPAMRNVATCYERGTGVPVDARAAMEWRIRSRAALGDRNAQAWLRQNNLK